MVKSRTYNTIPGLNYIQDSDLAFATIYVVEREGTQYDQWRTGMQSNRTFIHTASDGKIAFPLAFNPNEKIFVLYKPLSGSEPEVPPGVCVPAGVVPIELPDAIVGVPYSQTITLTGTPPFTIDGITLPVGLTLSNSGNTVLISGTPTIEGPVFIDFDIHNCGPGFANVNQQIIVYGPTIDFYVSNLSAPGVQINSVSGISYAIKTGSLPAYYYAGITGAHSAYTGTITVNITGLAFPQTLSLKRNGVDLEVITTSTDGNYTFAALIYAADDEIVILLN